MKLLEKWLSNGKNDEMTKFVEDEKNSIYEFIDFMSPYITKHIINGSFSKQNTYKEKDASQIINDVFIFGGSSIFQKNKYKNLGLINNVFLSLTQYLSNVFEIYKVFIPLKENKMKNLNLKSNAFNISPSLILGGSVEENIEIIPDCVDLYLRLPILCELYYDIFIKKNKERDRDDKILSFINFYTADTNNLLYLTIINLLKNDKTPKEKITFTSDYFTKINGILFFTKYIFKYDKFSEKDIYNFFKEEYGIKISYHDKSTTPPDEQKHIVNEYSLISNDYDKYIKNYDTGIDNTSNYDDKSIKKIIKYCNELYHKANKNINSAIDNFINFLHL